MKVSARIRGIGRQDQALEQLVARLSLERGHLRRGRRDRRVARGHRRAGGGADLVVPVARRWWLAGILRFGAAIADRTTGSGHGTIDIEHPGGDPQKEHRQHYPRPRAEPAIDRPSQPDGDDDRRHQLDPDAQTESQTLLKAWIATGFPLRPKPCLRLVELFAKPSQRVVRWRIFAHCGKRNHLRPVTTASPAGTRRTIKRRRRAVNIERPLPNRFSIIVFN